MVIIKRYIVSIYQQDVLFKKKFQLNKWGLHCKTLDLGGMIASIDPQMSLKRHQQNFTNSHGLCQTLIWKVRPRAQSLTHGPRCLIHIYSHRKSSNKSIKLWYLLGFNLLLHEFRKSINNFNQSLKNTITNITKLRYQSHT